MDNIVFHMQRYHPKTKKVLLCGDIVNIRDKENVLIDFRNDVIKILITNNNVHLKFTIFVIYITIIEAIKSWFYSEMV